MIIDSHAHLGVCNVFDANYTSDQLLGAMDKNRIDASVVLPMIGPPDIRQAHDDIARLAQQHPGRIYGVAGHTPHQDEDAYFAEAARCIRDLGFVAIKLHPLGHVVSPTGRAATKVFDAARMLGVPVIVHTGLGMPFALPSLVIPRAQQYPDLKIVLAHSGAFIFTAEAELAANLCPNIYLETSWCSPGRVRSLAETLGADRVMFGADGHHNVACELDKYRTTGLAEDLQEICLARTAMRVFNIQPAV